MKRGFFGAVCWGLNFPVSKLALAGTELHPGAFVTLRSAWEWRRSVEKYDYSSATT